MARYSAPQKDDYHIFLRKKAERIAVEIKASYPDAKTRVCIDSAPILERSFAHRSGMGFLGKNNMFIVPGHGSYLFLAEILTTALLPPSQDTTITEDLCGDCMRCVDACPTGALERPRNLNASKCLSYLTIEYDGNLDIKTGGRMGRCFLGCDICQEVCPLNRPEKNNEISLPGIREFLKMGEREFKTLFGQTALARPRPWADTKEYQSNSPLIKKRGFFGRKGKKNGILRFKLSICRLAGKRSTGWVWKLSRISGNLLPQEKPACSQEHAVP